MPSTKHLLIALVTALVISIAYADALAFFCRDVVDETDPDFVTSVDHRKTKVTVTPAKGADGTAWTITYKYDSIGNRILESHVSRDSSSLWKHEYDQKGRRTDVIWENTFSSGKTSIVHVHCIYDNDGPLIQEDVDTGDDGTIEDIVKYTRDPSGKILTLVLLDSDGKSVKSTANYTYWDSGLLHRISFIEDGEIVENYTFQYEGGRLSTIEHIDADGNVFGKTSAMYDKDGYLQSVEKSVAFDEEPSSVELTRMQHDKNGLITGGTKSDRDGRLIEQYKVRWEPR